ncbi:hypothetical protein PIB30_099402, partial [Stylosanthes scabra]|nr:hypothetical protein [Stylosanthes scabra]
MGTSNIKVKESPVKSEKERKRSISKNLLRSIVNEAFPRQRRQKLDVANLYDSQQSDKCIGSSNTTKEWVIVPMRKGASINTSNCRSS